MDNLKVLKLVDLTGHLTVVLMGTQSAGLSVALMEQYLVEMLGSLSDTLKVY